MRFQLTSRLREAMRIWRSLLEEHLRSHGQTRAQWEALLIIALSGGRSTQTVLARRLRIEGPTLVRLLDKLETDGLVERVQSASDRRAKTIRTTRKGDALVRKLIKSTDQLRAKFLAGWSEEELKQGIRFLERFLERQG